MIKKLYILFIAALFIQCSPKTTKTIADAGVSEAPMLTESFRMTAPVPSAAPKINIGKAETFVLDNGLQVILVENHKIPQVSFQITLKNDPFPEGDQVGFVSMAGDLLGRGTTTKSKAEIDESVDFLGASLSTFGTGLFASSLTKHTDVLLNIVSDVLYNPSFPEGELDKIKKIAISNIEASKSEPGAIVSNIKAKILYGENHPYGEVQTKENIDNITLENCKSYFSNFFIPNNAYLIIVGDLDVAKANQLANQYFGKWKRKPFKPLPKSSVELSDSRQVRFGNKDGAVQSVINVSYPLELKPGTPDVIPASVMNTILGGGFSSRLMQNLREDKAYTYGSRSSISSDPLIGSFTASASVRNEVTDSSVTQILYEMDRIRQNPVDESELQSIKNYMTGGFARSLESPQTIARFALNTFRYKLPADYYETYLKKLNAVTVADIQAMAQKYILPDKANIIVVGNKDEVAEKLTVFDDDQMVDFYDAFGKKIDYDNDELPEGLTAENVIEDYLEVIGGRDELTALKSLYIKMSAQMMGQNILMETYQKSPDKFAMIVGNGAMTFQEQVFDGKKAVTSQMGQKQEFTEGPQFDAMKKQAVMVAQLDYASDAYSLELTGIEDVDGQKCYKINIIKSDGEKSSEFYSVASSLLIRIVSSQEGPSGPLSIISDLSDYQEVDGIQFPGSITISGAMPQPMLMKTEEIQVNPEISAERFILN